MDLKTIRNKIIETTPKDWNKITCWGYGAGPSYHYAFSTETGERGVETEATGHANIAVLLEDVDISIAWGYDPDESAWGGGQRDFDFSDFLPSFPDEKTSRMYADVFYHGSLVDRALFVVADGGRYYVPIPRTEYPDKTGYTAEKLGEPVHHYTRWDIGFARIVHSFEHGHPFDELLSRMNYVLDDDAPGIY